MVIFFTILLLAWYDIHQKSSKIRKTILEIIRQLNLQEQEGLEVLDSALANVQDEVNRRQEFVRTLHEYGIFLMQRGIINSIQNEQTINNQNGHGISQALENIWNNYNQDFRKIQTLIFLERYRDLGFSRCNICLRDFKQHERIKRFPRECDHLFHIKCLEIWLRIEASCPHCLRSFLGHKYRNATLSASEDGEKYSRLTSWQYSQTIDRQGGATSVNRLTAASSGATPSRSCNQIIELYKTEFQLNRDSKNPFLR